MPLSLFRLDLRDCRSGEKGVRHRWAEYFWLCDSCALRMTVDLKGRKPGVISLLSLGARELSLTAGSLNLFC